MWRYHELGLDVGTAEGTVIFSVLYGLDDWVEEVAVGFEYG